MHQYSVRFQQLQRMLQSLAEAVLRRSSVEILRHHLLLRSLGGIHRQEIHLEHPKNPFLIIMLKIQYSAQRQTVDLHLSLAEP